MNVADWPGASDVEVPEHEPDGEASDTQSMADNDDATDGAVCVSVIDTAVNGTSPVLSATNVYVTVSPTADTEETDGVFDTVNAGDWDAVTTAVDGADVTGPPDGGVPDATAESSITPFVTSAWVTT